MNNMDSEAKEAIYPVSRVEDLLGTHIELPNRDQVLVDAEILGASQWRDMVDATQEDHRERGLIVSRKRNGRVVRSKIFISKEEDSQKSIATNIPHELRSLLLGRNMVFIHTHPLPSEVGHLRTTVFSDTDLQAFIKGNYNAIVMLDRGGAHLLLPISEYTRTHPSLEKDLVNKIVEKVRQNGGGTLDVVKEVSATLATRGFGYFYTPELDQTGEFVRFNTPENF